MLLSTSSHRDKTVYNYFKSKYNNWVLQHRVNNTLFAMERDKLPADENSEITNEIDSCSGRVIDSSWLVFRLSISLCNRMKARPSTLMYGRARTNTNSVIKIDRYFYVWITNTNKRRRMRSFAFAYDRFETAII